MLCVESHTCVNVARWYDGAILAQGPSPIPISYPAFSYPSGGEVGEWERME